MIERSKMKASKAGLQIDFRLVAAEKLPHEDETFDAVICTLVLHHLPDSIRGQSLSEMLRVLKPGGRLVLIDMKPVIKSNVPLIEKTGFREVEVLKAGFLFLGAIARK